MGKASEKQASGWKPGKSGNPRGRPKGSRNRTTLAVEKLLDGDAEKLTRLCIEKALDGDMVALRLCLERICPPRKDRPVSFPVAKLDSLDDAVGAMGSLLTAVASGDLTPQEAQAVAGVMETYRRTLETQEIEQRLTALEEAKDA